MKKTYDIVCVGGGIGGSGCATVLARSGLDVLVLEPTTEYPDIVRGEWIAPWGVAETKRTGLHDVFAAAGGHTVAKHIYFDEALDPATAIGEALPLGAFVPDVPGPLCIRHPVACQALADAAAEAGATVLRGVSNISVEGKVVRFAHPENDAEVTARLVIGADGRASPLRNALGISFEKVETQHYLSGVLVDGLDWWDDSAQAVATESDTHVLLFPQGGGRARLYIAYPVGDRDRYAGRDRAKAVLEAFTMDCWPDSNAFLDADVIGPAHSYRSSNSLAAKPFADGVVFVGDAAGFNDPIIGQGLAITARDTRIVTEAILGSGDWTAEMFEPYAEERAERMRRLRITSQIHSVVIGGQGPGRDPEYRAEARKDPNMLMFLGAELLGPDMVPADIFTDENVARYAGATSA
jgi:2-polyprenyl-6-methoxyphenol hydroxylase-like FAD-dependent oxidoreductase